MEGGGQRMRRMGCSALNDVSEFFRVRRTTKLRKMDEAFFGTAQFMYASSLHPIYLTKPFRMT